MTGTLPHRVLIVTPHYPPSKLGGTQLRARKMARWLARRGVSAQVVCVEHITKGPQNALVRVHRDTYEGIPVHRLSLTHTDSPQAFRYAYDHPDIADYIEEVIRAWQPNLVHLISGYLITANALAVARAQAVPTVVTLTDYWFLCSRINLIRSNGQPCGGPYDALDCTRCILSESRRYRLPEQWFPRLADAVWRLLDRRGKERIPLYQGICGRQELLRSLLRKADAIILPTNSLCDRFPCSQLQDRLHLVRHGLVLEDLGLDTPQEKSPSSLCRFGYMGQVSYVKGVDLLVDAYSRLLDDHQDVSLAIWGAGDEAAPYVARLRATCERLPRVDLHGRYEPAQVAEILRDIDVLVMPARWPEIGPFVVLEALAARTPVIGAAIGNMPELVEHERNGLLFEPDSVADLERQMRRILEEPHLLHRLREGIGPVRTAEDEMRETMEVYGEVMQSP